MRQTKLGKHSIVLYDSIDELPMKRFHKFNKMMLVDSGIGSDLNDIDRHLERIKAFVRQKENDHAMLEIENLRTNFFFVFQGLSPKYLAFAALVKEIDGKECDDLTDDGLKNVVEKLSDTPIDVLNKEIEDVKKKIEDDLLLYFPAMFDDASVKEYYDLVHKRIIAVLDGIVNGEDKKHDETLDRITMELLTYNKPNVFGGSESLEVRYDKQFDRMCHIISSNLNVSPKEYTVTEYYSAFDYIKEMMKQNKVKMK